MITELKEKRYNCTCERCEHKWVTDRPIIPTVCPKCKSPYYNTKRKEK